MVTSTELLTWGRMNEATQWVWLLEVQDHPGHGGHFSAPRWLELPTEQAELVVELTRDRWLGSIRELLATVELVLQHPA